MEAPIPTISYDIEELNKYSFKIQFKINENKITISALDKLSAISQTYKLEFSLDDFQQLDKYFKQYDSITELYEYLSDMEIEKKSLIELEENFIKLIISFPTASVKKNPVKKINFMLPKIEMKESDIILKLCEKMNEIDTLKEKINFLYYYLNINEKDYEKYKKFKSNPNFKQIINQSNIINDILDLKIPLEGIYKNLNKKIKEIKLLYQATRDGDQGNDFHSRCDGKENTLTFIKSTNNKKFGGFTSVAWDQNDKYIKDENAFVFSLDNKKCYFYKNNDDGAIIGNESYPVWIGKNNGANDIYISSGCLSNKNSCTSCGSNIYDGNKYVLNGENYFQAVDVETYQIILE